MMFQTTVKKHQLQEEHEAQFVRSRRDIFLGVTSAITSSLLSFFLHISLSYNASTTELDKSSSPSSYRIRNLHRIPSTDSATDRLCKVLQNSSQHCVRMLAVLDLQHILLRILDTNANNTNSGRRILVWNRGKPKICLITAAPALDIVFQLLHVIIRTDSILPIQHKPSRFLPYEQHLSSLGFHPEASSSISHLPTFEKKSERLYAVRHEDSLTLLTVLYPMKENLLENTHIQTFIALCNEDESLSSIGRFSLDSNFGVIYAVEICFEPIDRWTNRTEASQVIVQVRYQALSGLYAAFCEIAIRGTRPNIREALADCKYTLEIKELLSATDNLPENSNEIGPNTIANILFHQSHQSATIACLISKLIYLQRDFEPFLILLEFLSFPNRNQSDQLNRRIEAGLKSASNQLLTTAYQMLRDHRNVSVSEAYSWLQQGLKTQNDVSLAIIHEEILADENSLWELLTSFRDVTLRKSLQLFPIDYVELRESRLWAATREEMVDFDEQIAVRNRRTSAVRALIDKIQEMQIHYITHLNLRPATIKFSICGDVLLSRGYYNQTGIPPLSKALSDPSFVEEIYYYAPEVLKLMLLKDEIVNENQTYSDRTMQIYEEIYTLNCCEKQDVFSIGSILYRIFVGRMDRERSSYEQVRKAIERICDWDERLLLPVEFEDKYPKVVDIIHRCWDKPESRPSLNELRRLLSENTLIGCDGYEAASHSIY